MSEYDDERDYDPDNIIDPANFRENTRQILDARYLHGSYGTLIYDGGAFWIWSERTGCYSEISPIAVRETVADWYENKQKLVTVGENERPVDVKPNKAMLDNAMDALKSMTYSELRAPCWRDNNPFDVHLPVQDLIVARNGLFRITDDLGLISAGKPTPRLYVTNALDYDIDLDALPPLAWLSFLETIWPKDEESISTLQEFMGEWLVNWTALQKALMLVGPKRSGKGTIGRVATALIGAPNVCGPTLSSLAGPFGMWQLVNKSLAIISDARLSGRTDQAIIVERLLSIIGEDILSIDRKNLPPITLRLLVRFMMLTNELPRLNDASGALASRFIILTLKESFYGREDTTLTNRILTELPGVLLWAVRGLVRLRQRGHFIVPKSSADLVSEMEDLASPISAFVRDWCRVGSGQRCPAKDLFDAYCLWAKEQGNHTPGTIQVFGRDLRAILPNISVTQPREGDDRVRMYSGVNLTVTAEYTLSVERAKNEEAEKRRGRICA